jgi:hypothetical protein
MPWCQKAGNLKLEQLRVVDGDEVTRLQHRVPR